MPVDPRPTVSTGGSRDIRLGITNEDRRGRGNSTVPGSNPAAGQNAGGDRRGGGAGPGQGGRDLGARDPGARDPRSRPTTGNPHTGRPGNVGAPGPATGAGSGAGTNNGTINKDPKFNDRDRRGDRTDRRDRNNGVDRPGNSNIATPLVDGRRDGRDGRRFDGRDGGRFDGRDGRQFDRRDGRFSPGSSFADGRRDFGRPVVPSRVFSRHFGDPGFHHAHSWWYPGRRFSDYGFHRFNLLFGSGGFSFGFSFANYWPCHYRPVFFSYYGGCWDPWWDWYYCRPVVYRPYYPVFYYDYMYPIYSPSYTTYSSGTYAATNSYTPPTSYTTTDSTDGWDLLASGNYRDARRVFERDLNAHPNDGLPQIGYAVAAALLDRNFEAVSMMRRALRYDPEAIREVPQNAQLDQALGHALDAYLDRAEREPGNIDVQFMIAALRFMMGDTSRAFFALDRAMDLGDKDASAENLRMMLRTAMERQAAPEPSTTSPSAPMPPLTDQPPSIIPPDQPREVPY